MIRTLSQKLIVFGINYVIMRIINRGEKMKNIIICGDCGSKMLTKSVIRACAANGGASVVENNKVYETAANPKFLVVSSDNISEIECKSGIIVFGKMLDSLRSDMKTGKLIPVIDTANIKALNIVRNSGAAAIGCSMSEHDTISISGLTGFPTKMVSLQRTVRTVDGDIVEPHDFLVKLSETTAIYPLLASCSVLLLSGISTLKGYSF